MAAHGTSQVGTRARRSAVSVGDPVPAAKITAPGVPEWAVQRPRITKLIAEDVRWCQLTVVTGRPGAGKTTALAQWAVAEPGIVAWVCLDEFDNRTGVFWSSVVAALRSRALPCRGRCPALRGRMATMCLCSSRRRWPRTAADGRCSIAAAAAGGLAA